MEKYPSRSELAARISSYELAYRMQGCAPSAIDLSSESPETRKLYGLGDKVTEPFGRQCLMARRLVERGVRFVQLYHGGMGNQDTDTWDAHSNLDENHRQHAAESDLPIAGLLTDLASRGLLDTTLVVWHGEFGRMPISQRGVGRDHNPGTMTVWMAGAGIKGGQVVGSSDEFGYKALEQPVSVHDLHATMLHLLGMDHKKLTYRFNGRDVRLTDVYGTPVPQIVS
jgi:arylsulfatase A-like enzyme